MSDKLLDLKEASERIGYSVWGLRKIVARSQKKLAGTRTLGATIKFFQTGPHAPIRFKPEWLDEFIKAHTLDPAKAVAKNQPRQHKPKKLAPLPLCEGEAGFDDSLLSI